MLCQLQLDLTPRPIDLIYLTKETKTSGDEEMLFKFNLSTYYSTNIWVGVYAIQEVANIGPLSGPFFMNYLFLLILDPHRVIIARISWFKRQSLTFMILKYRFNSFRDAFSSEN